MTKNNCGIEKTENTEKESKLTSENDSCTDNRTQYCGKKKKNKKRTQPVEETDVVFQCNGDTVESNSSPENKKINQQYLCKDDIEDNFVIGNDTGLLAEVCPVKFIKTVNPFLAQGYRKVLETPKDENKNKNKGRQNQSDRNVSENQTVLQFSGNTNHVIQAQKLKSRKRQTQRKKQLGVLINNSRYEACIVGESPKVNNIEELYYKYVTGINNATVGTKDLDVIDNDNATIGTEDANMGEMSTQLGTRMQRTTNKTKKERILALSTKSRVIRKPTIDHSQSDTIDWELHTVQGVRKYTKSLNKMHILRAIFNFKGASLVNVVGYPTQIGHISVSTDENGAQSKSEETSTSEKQSEETCNSEKQSEETCTSEKQLEETCTSQMKSEVTTNAVKLQSTLSGEQRNNHVGPTSRNSMSDGQIIINNALSNRHPAVWS